MPPRPPVMSRRFSLVLAGQPAGPIAAVAGGEPFAEVVRTPATPFVTKSIGAAHYRPVVLTLAADLDPAVRAWLKAVLDGTASPVDGAISYLDVQGREVTRLEWSGGEIEEVALPGLDASNREAALVRISISVASTKRIAGSGQPVASAPPQRKALVSNFRLKLGNLPTNRVAAVGPLVVRRAGAGLDIDEFVLDVSAVDAGPYHDWAQKFIVQGQHGPADERTGAVELLSPNLAEVILGVELSGVGIFSLADSPSSGSGDAVARIRPSLYCERLSLVAS